MNTPFRIIIAFAISLLTACQTNPPATINDIETTTQLTNPIEKPIQAKIAYHFPFEEYRKKITASLGFDAINHSAGRNLKKSIDFVLPGFFENTTKLEPDSEFSYLFTFKSNTTSTSTTFRVSYATKVDMQVFDVKGNKIFEHSAKADTSALNAYNDQAIINAMNSAIKENIVSFFNSQASASIQSTATQELVIANKLDLKNILELKKPAYSGSAFYINDKGNLVTSSHILKDCLTINLSNKGETLDANIIKKSSLLDITVLSSKLNNQVYAKIRKGGIPELGEEVFTMGYPLSDILSGEPNLTTGNVSSLGALKGAKGFYQFTAPVQPGNSGGPVYSKDGQLLGMVASQLAAGSLNDIPQNVNFAVMSELLMRFLTNNNISYTTATNGQAYPTAIKEANQSTYKISCYK